MPTVMNTAPAVTISLAPRRAYSAPATNDTIVNVPISGSSASPACSGAWSNTFWNSCGRYRRDTKNTPAVHAHGDARRGELAVADDVARDQRVAPGVALGEQEEHEADREDGEQPKHQPVAPAELGHLVEGDQQGDEAQAEGDHAEHVEAIAGRG